MLYTRPAICLALDTVAGIAGPSRWTAGRLQIAGLPVIVDGMKGPHTGPTLFAPEKISAYNQPYVNSSRFSCNSRHLHKKKTQAH